MVLLSGNLLIMIYKYQFLLSILLLFSCTLEENYTILEKIDINEDSKSLGSWINAIESDSHNNLWLGVEYPGIVYKSNYFNYEWIKTGLNNYGLDNIIISKEDIIFVTPYYTNISSDSLILKSGDQGETWIPIGLTNARLFSLFTSDDNVLYAGSSNCIYYSKNYGLSWFKIDLSELSQYHFYVEEMTIDNNSIWLELKKGIDSDLVRYDIETNKYKNYGRLSHINKIIVHENGDVFIAHQAHDEASGSVSRILTEIDTLEWFPMPYIDWFQIYVSDIDFYNNGLLAATSEGLKFSNDKGETWTSAFIDSFFTAMEIDKNGIIYAGTVNGFVVKIAEIEKLLY